jgi:bacillithiol system protein YtxJ
MIALTKVSQWQELLQQSHKHPVIIFKHSNACPTSAKAFERMRGAESSLPQPIHIVVVQEARTVSDAIAEDVGVTHESPQLIVISDMQAVIDLDHEAVEAEPLAPYLEI